MEQNTFQLDFLWLESLLLQRHLQLPIFMQLSCFQLKSGKDQGVCVCVRACVRACQVSKDQGVCVCVCVGVCQVR